MPKNEADLVSFTGDEAGVGPLVEEPKRLRGGADTTAASTTGVIGIIWLVSIIIALLVCLIWADFEVDATIDSVRAKK
ncbi:hypothetical protein ANCCAN_08112 [Ancylostoma caninum]|uniref:Uncharacterized protein n=1 Tax=Ancylostoma caninum TaxID=29170 RepID=A0A368GS51_ANCCA|nr:hypothetical protein ANCCAN_08112 [Ancylostoma caninum]